MSAQFLVDLIVITLAKEVHIQLAQERSKRVRVCDLELFAGPSIDFEEVIEPRAGSFEPGFKETFLRDSLSGKTPFLVVAINDGQRFCVWTKRPND
jgi:hypothetical protein